MAGDIEITERAILEGAARAAELGSTTGTGRVIHQYGRVSILAVPREGVEAAPRLAAETLPSG
jgi:hypothetical protein